MPVRGEIDGEPGAAEGPGGEPCDAQIAPRRDHQRGEPECPDCTGRLSGSGAHPTTTTELAAWLP